jgi:hypothetical protein
MSKFSRTRRTALAGGAALVVAGGIAANVRAQQTQAIEAVAEPGERADVLFFADGLEVKLGERRQAWLNAVAGKLGVTPEKLDQAMQDVAKEQGFPNASPPLMVPFPPMPAEGLPGSFTLRIDTGFEAAAKAIGISEDQLKTESKQGKSLAEIAKAHNVDPKGVADALKAQRRTDIDKAVADGKLPADIATRLKAHLEEEIDRLIQLPGFAAGRGIFRFERSVVGAP